MPYPGKDITGYEGIAFDVRSEENLIYKFGLHDTDEKNIDRKGQRITTWEAEFEVPATPKGREGTWTRIEIPFCDFLPI